jgi:hypothetical protein
MASKSKALFPAGERRPETGELVSMTDWSLNPAGSGGVLIAPVRGDLGFDVGRRQRAEPAPVAVCPPNRNVTVSAIYCGFGSRIIARRYS